MQDTGLLIGSIQGDQSISFQAMKQKLAQLQEIVQADPAVATVVGVTGGRQANSGFVYISLKPFAERKITADGVVARLRGKLAHVAGARLFLVAVSDLRTGGRQSNATYQYTLLSDDTADALQMGAAADRRAAEASDVLKDVNSDQQQGGLRGRRDDRPRRPPRGSASRSSAIDNTLYDAFGQRQVSTIYNALNQYHVVMEVAPRYWQDPSIAERHLGLHLGRQSFRRAADQRRRRPVFGADRQRPARRRRSPAIRRAIWRPNSLAASGHSSASAGAAVSTSMETMVPLSAFGELQPRPDAARRQSPGPVRRLDDLVQSARPATRSARRRRRSTTPMRDDRHAVDRARRLRRHRRDLPAVAGDAAAADRRGAARRSTSCSAFSTRATSIR